MFLALGVDNGSATYSLKLHRSFLPEFGITLQDKPKGIRVGKTHAQSYTGTFVGPLV